MYVQSIKLFSTDSMPHLASQYGFALESLLFCCCHFLGGEQEMVGGDGFICLTTPHIMHPCLVFLSPSFFFLFSLSLFFFFCFNLFSFTSVCLFSIQKSHFKKKNAKILAAPVWQLQWHLVCLPFGQLEKKKVSPRNALDENTAISNQNSYFLPHIVDVVILFKVPGFLGKMWTCTCWNKTMGIN